MLLVLAAIVVGAALTCNAAANSHARARIAAGIVPQPPHEHPTNGALARGVTGGPVTRGRCR